MSTRRRKKSNKTLIFLLLAIVVVVLAIILLPSCGGNGGQKSADANEPEETEVYSEAEVYSEDDELEMTTIVKEGSEAPDFTVEMIDGSKVTLSKLKGNVVLVNFWATWCPPCRAELARVQTEIVDRFAGKPFRMIAISRGEDRAAVEAFLADNGYHFPAGLDTDESIFNKFASNFIPRNFLVGADGKVVLASAGYDETEFAHLVQTIEQTLENL